MRTTVELPDDLFRRAKAQAAHEGKSLKDLITSGLKLALAKPVSRLVITPMVDEESGASRPPRKRGNAGAWGRRFAGAARLAPGETTDAARAAHYREKYDV